MGSIGVVSCLVLLAALAQVAEPSKDAMRYMTSGFLKVLGDCRQEVDSQSSYLFDFKKMKDEELLNLGDQIITDLFHYWRRDYSLLNSDIGCLIICMSKKLDLIDTNGRLHHGNAHEFAIKHGADEEVASKLVSIIHECEKVHERDDDECARVLEVAKCFRTGIYELNWNPDIEVVVIEVLTEI